MLTNLLFVLAIATAVPTPTPTAGPTPTAARIRLRGQPEPENWLMLTGPPQTCTLAISGAHYVDITIGARCVCRGGKWCRTKTRPHPGDPTPSACAGTQDRCG